ncbi:PAS domain S-box protein [Sulfuricurvum sp.]|uniref:sensor histidine kinase n=1 Tax=Sulfuricurvum sp. TaxID=2025608 RepID=UPI0025E77C9D|nr:PAS domain S-box protein [Sulfuricurvum sp.]
MMESVVAILSLLVAFFIYKFDEGDSRFDRYHALALSLIAIGMLSFFHAASPEHSVFVWLYVMGRILGSLLLLSLFLPERQLSTPIFRALPYGVIGVSVSIAVALLFLSMVLPASELNREFNIWEKWANNLSALFFFLGSLVFFRHYRREYQDADFYFGALLLLLSSASFYFQFSHLWDGAWWYWHFINVCAFGLILYYYIGYFDEQKKQWMESKIDEERIKFVATFEQAAVGIAHVAPNGSWLRVNHKLCDIVGYSREELLALTFQDITHPDDLQIDMGYVNEMLMRKRTSYKMRKRYFHKNGSIVWIDLSVTLIWKDESTPDFFIAVIVDVGEEVNAKEALQTLNAELEHKVFERTAALQNTYDEMEAFTYSVSHDLRSPLRATDGFSQALLEDYGEKLDETARDYLSRIRAASQKMARLIDDLLQLSRQTRTDMKPQTIDLGSMARKITAELSTQEPERAINIIIGEGLNAYADPHLMNVVLTNLLDNAWKYTSLHSHAVIEFGSMIENGEIIFYVRDDGAGFDMAYVDQLFKPFHRLHSAQEFLGNGIGLTMVNRIIKRHFGRVWAQGEVEKGATIYFTLGLNSKNQSTQEH